MGADWKEFTYTAFLRMVGSHTAMHNIGKSAAESAAARLLALDAAATIDAAGPSVVIDLAKRNRLRAACGHAGELLRTAVDRPVSVSGASSFADASLVRRYWKETSPRGMPSWARRSRSSSVAARWSGPATSSCWSSLNPRVAMSGRRRRRRSRLRPSARLCRSSAPWRRCSCRSAGRRSCRPPSAPRPPDAGPRAR
jgi:hypothetical protein